MEDCDAGALSAAFTAPVVITENSAKSIFPSDSASVDDTRTITRAPRKLRDADEGDVGV
jgi:hypothetical protein